MGFSVTGHLLDNHFKTIIVIARDREDGSGFSSKNTVTSNNKLNTWGFYPIVSTITGIGRLLLGIIHTIVHLVCAIFTNREHNLTEAAWGGKNIARACIEIVPLAGNFTTFLIDVFATKKYETMADEKIKQNPLAYENYVTLFTDGEEVGKRKIDDFNREIKALKDSGSPSSLQMETIIINE